MQKGKQPLWVRLQLLARLTLNAGEDAANQPARLAHLDDGNDRAILVQRHQGPAQIVRLGHRGTPSIDVSDEIATLAARPIASLCWRETDSNFQYASTVRGGRRPPRQARSNWRTGYSGAPGRFSTTSSMRPNSFASAGDRNLSRSTAAWIAYHRRTDVL